MDIAGIYKHYKNKEYQVLGEAIDKDNNDLYIFYMQLYGDHNFWIRPKDMFLDDVMTNQGVKKRFEKISEGTALALSQNDILKSKITHSETLHNYHVVDFDETRNVYIVAEL